MRCARRLSSAVFRASKTRQSLAVTTTREAECGARLNNEHGVANSFSATANFQPEKWFAKSTFYLPAIFVDSGSTFGPIRSPTSSIFSSGTELVHPKKKCPNSASIAQNQATRLRLSIPVSPQLATWQHLLRLYTTPAGPSGDTNEEIHRPDSSPSGAEASSVQEAGVVSNCSRSDVFNWPNAVSVARLLSGPPIAL